LHQSGERFKGLIPPVIAAPCCAIRRPAAAVFTLGDYVDAGVMSAAQAERPRLGVRHQNNSLVTAGT
jgi:type IV secretion system protein VirB11